MTRTLLAVLGLALGPGLCLASTARAQSGLDVPSEPVARTSDHFPETNERRHDLFEPFVRGRGGAYLGVGSDQSYTLAAMAGAELVYIVDYDPIVTRLHRALLSLVGACETPRCLVDALAPGSEAASAERIAAGLSSSWEAASWEDRRTLRAFRVHRPLLARRVAEQLAAPHTWLSNPAWYAHVRRLAREAKIIARTGDLTGPRTVRAMAADATRRGARFRVVYLSNAEEYFEYTPQFVANLRALPRDPDTLVLRTVRDHGFPRPRGDRGWHYNLQPLDDLEARLGAGYLDSSWILTDLRAAPGVRGPLLGAPPGVSRLDATVPARARRGPARWWMSSESPRVPSSHRGPARLLAAVRRAVLPALSTEDAAAVRALNLEGTEVAELGRVRLPHDPRTGAPFVLSGEPAEGAATEVDDPESVLLALLFDGLARAILPSLLAVEERAEDAAALRDHPMAADLYAAYRLRERLLELCPAPPRSRRALAFERACGAALELVRPATTRRTQPSWSERQRRIQSAVRTLATLAPDSSLLRAHLERLVDVARNLERLVPPATPPRGSEGPVR